MDEKPQNRKREQVAYFLQVGCNLLLLVIGVLSWWNSGHALGLFVAGCGAVGLIASMMLRSLRVRARSALRFRWRRREPPDRSE